MSDAAYYGLHGDGHVAVTNADNRAAARGEEYGLPRIIASLVFTLAAVAAVRGQATGAFVPLFDGTLNGWVIENTQAGNISVRDGVLRVDAPSGWLRSMREYGDVTVRAEFRFVTADADSGLFVRASGTGQFMRGWPNNSYQVQIRNPATASRLPPVGGLFRHGMPPGATEFDATVVEKIARPTGEWQTLEVEVTGNRLTARLNGTQVLNAMEIANPRGYLGIQAETGTVEFRSIEIREPSRP
jgi:hypothetical protein